jgi:hypothetical protein
MSESESIEGQGSDLRDTQTSATFATALGRHCMILRSLLKSHTQLTRWLYAARLAAYTQP